jgi:ABC-type nitrate/sulfonate/bicarbonate transport system permease component
MSNRGSLSRGFLLVRGAGNGLAWTASLPFMMTGIRLSVGRAVVGMVVAEMFTAISGLGGAIVRYSSLCAMDRLLIVVILLAAMGTR